ncbi:hypothetical protein MGSAQ_000418 [marine sediment metagenome]|uniref:Uncharacterized protein n=1 Tax=marine sediment metagenome TaxID=412755 RepID=A0A1B6NXC7_9ZZZZ
MSCTGSWFLGSNPVNSYQWLSKGGGVLDSCSACNSLSSTLCA